MITATGLELRAGARILINPTTLRVQPGGSTGRVASPGGALASRSMVLKVQSVDAGGTKQNSSGRTDALFACFDGGRC